MSGHEDCGTCDACGTHVDLNHEPPCWHGYVACPDCGHTRVCAACRSLA